ncbi:hypothetical protein SAE02_50490 [Skermanella aerolata]|uniref:Uncharacterized protein n=1 Tax=Skermanella aerolata TaxID=393310 RepID=A0A512DWQ7_9PROT|nr:hypothetical protein [Skermanella aerolata]GEO40901.1 hypothetical protein SAE02_50490 [Skermanella aerolata]
MFIILYYLNGVGKGDIGIRSTCARLFINSFQSISASIQVARYGYWREYGNIARSIVENLAVIVHLVGNDNALEEFHKEKLQSSKSITYARKRFSVLGPLYGLLSNQFVHIGPECAELRFTECYNQGDDDIDFIDSNLRAVTLLSYIVAELVFFEQVDVPKYWECIGEGEYKTNPSEEAHRWQADLLGVSLEDIDANNDSTVG